MGNVSILSSYGLDKQAPVAVGFEDSDDGPLLLVYDVCKKVCRNFICTQDIVSGRIKFPETEESGYPGDEDEQSDNYGHDRGRPYDPIVQNRCFPHHGFITFVLMTISFHLAFGHPHQAGQLPLECPNPDGFRFCGGSPDIALILASRDE
jgi:hypothetical protein